MSSLNVEHKKKPSIIHICNSSLHINYKDFGDYFHCVNMGTRKKLAFSATALKQEKPEMDDFERKKNSGSKGEIF